MKKNIELTIVLKIKTKEEYKYNFVNFNIYKNEFYPYFCLYFISYLIK